MPVFLNNVDDYLGPSQACINPLFAATPSSSATIVNDSSVTDGQSNSLSPHSSAEHISQQDIDGNNSSGLVDKTKRRIRRRPPPRIQNEEDAYQGKKPIRLLHTADDGVSMSVTSEIGVNHQQSIKKKKKATVKLSDCLSCSGCVTSAEAVLMSHHSVDKFREVVQKYSEEERQIVFTVSSSALADLYRHIYLSKSFSEVNHKKLSNEFGNQISTPSRREFLRQITNFLHSEFGVIVVVDGSVTQRISLLESAHEFCHRYREKQNANEKDLPLAETGLDITTVSLSSTQTRFISKKSNNASNKINDMHDEEDAVEVTVVDHPPGLTLKSDNCSVEANRHIHRMYTQASTLPMLASSCPGFVCLVEKTAAPVVPLLSTAKSPMTVAGTLLKSGLVGAKGKPVPSSNHQCFHVAVMPCHDKKLEAGRNDFTWERQTLTSHTNATMNVTETATDIVKEVDLVLTTVELLEILTSTVRNIADDFNDDHSNVHLIRQYLKSSKIADESKRPCVLITDTDSHSSSDQRESITAVVGSNVLDVNLGIHGSGSYADFIFRYAALELFGCKLSDTQPLPWAYPSNATTSAVDQSMGMIRRRRKRQETSDLRSITLHKQNDGSYSCTANKESIPVLKFATAYGFKNVQLILQSLSKDGYTSGVIDAKDYDYVEVMACPSGCPNGGGQIGAFGQRETPKETKERVSKTMSLIPSIYPDSGDRTLASSLYASDDVIGTDSGYNQQLTSSLKGGCFGENARRLLHTRFHVVPKLELSSGATAGVAVSDTKW